MFEELQKLIRYNNEFEFLSVFFEDTELCIQIKESDDLSIQRSSQTGQPILYKIERMNNTRYR